LLVRSDEGFYWAVIPTDALEWSLSFYYKVSPTMSVLGQHEPRGAATLRAVRLVKVFWRSALVVFDAASVER
jgi:hypothetical protein